MELNYFPPPPPVSRFCPILSPHTRVSCCFKHLPEYKIALKQYIRSQSMPCDFASSVNRENSTSSFFASSSAMTWIFLLSSSLVSSCSSASVLARSRFLSFSCSSRSLSKSFSRKAQICRTAMRSVWASKLVGYIFAQNTVFRVMSVP